MVLREVAWLLRLAAGGVGRRRRPKSIAVTQADSRELTAVMRSLPGRYVDRLPD